MMNKTVLLTVTISALLLSLTASFPTTNQNDNNAETQGKIFEVMAGKRTVKRQIQSVHVPPLVSSLAIYDRIMVVKENGKYCVYFKDENSEQQLVTCNPTCGVKFNLTYLSIKYPLTIGCASDEENHLGLCYKKCSLLANPNYPLRTASNTCAKNGCGPTEDLDTGLCYPKCEPNYNGVGPVCWGHCDHFCPDHEDHGVHCYRWWPPHSCTKPSYGRGAGTLPNAPWTNGLGCNGFGIANDGGCARIDISYKVPFPSCHL